MARHWILPLAHIAFYRIACLPPSYLSNSISSETVVLLAFSSVHHPSYLLPNIYSGKCLHLLFKNYVPLLVIMIVQILIQFSSYSIQKMSCVVISAVLLSRFYRMTSLSGRQL